LEVPDYKIRKEKKGEGQAFKDKATEVKGSRHALLKNPASLTDKQEAAAGMLAISNPKLCGARLRAIPVPGLRMIMR
jgi:hypothetical protein